LPAQSPERLAMVDKRYQTDRFSNKTMSGNGASRYQSIGGSRCIEKTKVRRQKEHFESNFRVITMVLTIFFLIYR
jgi:hypothetical protein